MWLTVIAQLLFDLDGVGSANNTDRNLRPDTHIELQSRIEKTHAPARARARARERASERASERERERERG
eukprot:COSAG02_NODE_54810_length_294_cov_0.712821_1_plen_69_part_10